MTEARVPKDVVHSELEVIRNKHEGKLRPPDVVAAAEPEAAPLHPCFTWDDAIAAVQHRLWEARQLIRTVHVVVDKRQVAAYVNIPASKPADSFYRPVEAVVHQPDEFQRSLGMLLDKVKSAQRALDDLKHVAATLSPDDSRLSMIAVAMEAFAAASAAVMRIN